MRPRPARIESLGRVPKSCFLQTQNSSDVKCLLVYIERHQSMAFYRRCRVDPCTDFPLSSKCFRGLKRADVFCNKNCLSLFRSIPCICYSCAAGVCCWQQRLLFYHALLHYITMFLLRCCCSLIVDNDVIRTRFIIRIFNTSMYSVGIRTTSSHTNI